MRQNSLARPPSLPDGLLKYLISGRYSVLMIINQLKKNREEME